MKYSTKITEQLFLSFSPEWKFGNKPRYWSVAFRRHDQFWSISDVKHKTKKEAEKEMRRLARNHKLIDLFTKQILK